MSETQFWGLTTPEIDRVLDAAVLREETTLNRLVSQAWLTAKLQRTKRMPTLQKLLNSVRRQKPLTVAEKAQLAAEHTQLVSQFQDALSRARSRKAD